MTETWLLVNSGAYYCWLLIRERYRTIGSDDLLSNAETEVMKMKGEVKARRRRDMLNELNVRIYDDEADHDRRSENVSISSTSVEPDTRREQAFESGTAGIGSFSSWSRLYRRKVPDASV